MAYHYSAASKLHPHIPALGRAPSSITKNTITGNIFSSMNKIEVFPGSFRMIVCSMIEQFVDIFVSVR